MAAVTKNEWRYWPQREDVTLRKQAAPGLYDAVSLSARGGAVKRRAPTWKEMTASAGAVTARNLVWLLPAVNLPEGIVPRAGDLIRATEADGSEIDHTVLEAQVGKYGQTHRCVTIALAVVYELSALGVLTRPSNARDDAGRAALTEYTEVARVRCRVQPQDSQGEDRFDLRTTSHRFTAYLDAQVRPDAHDVFTVTTYVTPGGAIDAVTAYTVLGYRAPERLDQLCSLDLEEA